MFGYINPASEGKAGVKVPDPEPDPTEFFRLRLGGRDPLAEFFRLRLVLEPGASFWVLFCC